MSNTTLKNAIRHLYGKGVITTDKDISQKTGYNKSTVSSYISGNSKPSANFLEAFEKAFNLKLKNFETGGTEEVVPIEEKNAAQLLNETVLQIKAEVQTVRQILVEVLASVSNRSVLDIQTTVTKALDHNLQKLYGELK